MNIIFYASCVVIWDQILWNINDILIMAVIYLQPVTLACNWYFRKSLWSAIINRLRAILSLSRFHPNFCGTREFAIRNSFLSFQEFFFINSMWIFAKLDTLKLPFNSLGICLWSICWNKCLWNKVLMHLNFLMQRNWCSHFVSRVHKWALLLACIFPVCKTSWESSSSCV